MRFARMEIYGSGEEEMGVLGVMGKGKQGEARGVG